MANTVIKISDDYQNVIAQISNPSSLQYEEELVNTGDLNFVVSIKHPDINNILLYKKAELFIVDNGQDESLWTGYISDIENDFNNVAVTCSDGKSFLQKKVIFSDKNWTGVDIQDVLQEIVDEANTRSGGFSGNLNFETNISGNVNKEFKLGTTYYKILNEIARLFDAEWKLYQNTIIFKDTIGEDKTSGENFIEFVNNPSSPNENNIREYSSKRNGKQIITSLIGKDSGAPATFQFNTGEFGFIEGFKKFNDGNLSLQTQEEVNKTGASQSEIEISVNSNAIDFRQVNIGDSVKIRIERGSQLTDLNESLKVVKKSVKWQNKIFIFDIGLSKLLREVRSSQNFISDLDSRIRQLELN